MAGPGLGNAVQSRHGRQCNTFHHRLLDFVNIEIDCYGPASRWCGADRLTLELPGDALVRDAIDQLAARYPEFAARRASIAVAIDDAIVSTQAPLNAGNRLALIPPVSGG